MSITIRERFACARRAEKLSNPATVVVPPSLSMAATHPSGYPSTPAIIPTPCAHGKVTFWISLASRKTIQRSVFTLLKAV